MQNIFISYSRLDSARIEQLVNDLEASGKVNVFRDTQDILPTEEWKGRLEQLLEKADAIVFALSPHSAKSEVCAWEVQYAQSLNKRIAPVVISEVEPASIPEELTKYNYIFFTPEHDYQKSLANLHTALTININWIREHTRLVELALRWDRSGRPNSSILRGEALSDAENWIATKPADAPEPTILHRQFIMQSRKAATKRTRFWVAGSVSVAIMSGGLAILSELNRRVAVEQRERVERVLLQTTEASANLVGEISHEYSRQKNIPKKLTLSILDEASKLIAGLDGVGEADGNLKLNGALAQAELSSAYLNNGDIINAKIYAEFSLKTLQELFSKNQDNIKFVLSFFAVYDRMGDIYWQSDNYEKAKLNWKNAHEIISKVKISEQTASFNAISYENLGRLAFEQEEFWESLELFKKSLNIHNTWISEKNNITSKLAIANLYEVIAVVHNEFGEDKLAQESHATSLKILSNLSKNYSSNTGIQESYAKSLMSFAEFNLDKSKYTKTVDLLHEYHGVMSDLHQSDLDWLFWKEMLIDGYERLGSAYYLSGKIERSVKEFKSAYYLTAEILSGGDGNIEQYVRLSNITKNYAGILSQENREKEAIGYLNNTLNILVSNNFSDINLNAEIANIRNDLAWNYLLINEQKIALDLAKLAVEAIPAEVVYKSNLAHALLLNGQVIEANDIYISYIDEPLSNGLLWQETILGDLLQLKEAGLEIVVAPHIIKKLTAD